MNTTQGDAASAGFEVPSASKSRLVGLKELRSGGVKVDWLIEGVLPANVIAVLFAAPSAGKSFVGLDWDLSIASTRETWQGHRLKHGPVVYVVAENYDGVPKRVEAWERMHGRLDDETPIHILREPANLFESGDVRMLLDDIAALPEKPVLIVIDTLGRSMDGGKETDNSDMNRVIASADLIRRETGATVLFVHHKGWSGSNPRGASALKAGCTTVIEVERSNPEKDFVTGDTATLKCRKMNNAAYFQDIKLSVQVVPVDDAGETSIAFAEGQSGKTGEVQPARKRHSGGRLSAATVLAALVEVGRPCGAAELTRYMGLGNEKRGTVQKMLERQAEKGTVALAGDGLYRVTSSTVLAA